jgi:hypothetical protein
MSIGGEYLKTVTHRFTEAKITAEKAIKQLTESELFWSPNEESNSIAIIIKHMSGNMVSRWTDFLHTDVFKRCSSSISFNADKKVSQPSSHSSITCSFVLISPTNS